MLKEVKNGILYFLVLFAISFISANHVLADASLPYRLNPNFPLSNILWPLFPIQLILNIIVEVPIYFIFGFRKFRSIFLVVIANIISALVLDLGIWVVATITRFSENSGLFILLLVMEVVVLIIETLFLRLTVRYTLKKIFLAVLLANIMSFLIGGFIFNLVGALINSIVITY